MAHPIKLSRSAAPSLVDDELAFTTADGTGEKSRLALAGAFDGGAETALNGRPIVDETREGSRWVAVAG